MKTELFDENDRAYFSSINDHMTDKTAQAAIRRLCGYLKRVYGKNVILLLNEYDTPMQEAYVNEITRSVFVDIFVAILGL